MCFLHLCWPSAFTVYAKQQGRTLQIIQYTHHTKVNYTSAVTVCYQVNRNYFAIIKLLSTIKIVA